MGIPKPTQDTPPAVGERGSVKILKDLTKPTPVTKINIRAILCCYGLAPVADQYLIPDHIGPMPGYTHCSPIMDLQMLH